MFLRHQLNIAQRRLAHRPRLRGSDRALVIWMTRIYPGLLDLAQVVTPPRGSHLDLVNRLPQMRRELEERLIKGADDGCQWFLRRHADIQHMNRMPFGHQRRR